MLTIIDETFNGARAYRPSFRWLKILSAPAAITVKWGMNAPDSAWTSMAQGEGFRAKPGAPDFGYLEITNPSLQAIRVQIGDDESFSDSIVGTVTANVSDDAARLLGITYGNLGQIAQESAGGVNAIVTANRGRTYTTSYKSNAALAANTPETIIAPASNPNGLWVTKAGFMSHTGGTAGAVILAKASAPANTTDGDPICSPETFILQVGGVSQMCAGKTDGDPIFVAGGKGLYRISGALETVAYGMALLKVL